MLPSPVVDALDDQERMRINAAAKSSLSRWSKQFPVHRVAGPMCLQAYVLGIRNTMEPLRCGSKVDATNLPHLEPSSFSLGPSPDGHHESGYSPYELSLFSSC